MKWTSLEEETLRAGVRMYVIFSFQTSQTIIFSSELSWMQVILEVES